MILALNIDNEYITAAFYHSLENKTIARRAIHKGMTADDFAVAIAQMASLYGVCGEPERVIISSVAPSVTEKAKAGVILLYNVKPTVVGPGVKTGINIKINDPSQLGGDLVAMGAGVCARYPLPAVFVYIDSRVTVSYIDGDRGYMGTIIAPGPGKMLVAVVEGADLLTSVDLSDPGKVVGADTAESIKSGVIYGCAAMIDGLISRIKEQNQVKSVVATGLMAGTVLPYCREKISIDETLLTDGLYHILERQKKRI